MPTKVNPLDLTGVHRMRAWSQGGPAHWQYRRISYGQCDQGWFVKRTGQTWSGAWLVSDEREACEAIEKFMDQKPGEWVRTPAVYSGRDASPQDPGTWYASGARWIFGEPPEGFTGQVVRNGD